MIKKQFLSNKIKKTLLSRLKAKNLPENPLKYQDKIDDELFKSLDNNANLLRDITLYLEEMEAISFCIEEHEFSGEYYIEVRAYLKINKNLSKTVIWDDCYPIEYSGIDDFCDKLADLELEIKTKLRGEK